MSGRIDAISKDYALNNVIPVVLNYDEYIEDLSNSDVFFENMGDFLVIYKVILNPTEINLGLDFKHKIPVSIDNEFLEKNDISYKELQISALENLDKNIWSVNFGDLLVENAIMNGEETCDLPALYLVSNNDKVYGANALLNKNILERFCDDFDSNDLYIIPTSINDILVVDPASMDTSFIINIINDINTNKDLVDEDKDILSNNLFVFNRQSGELNSIDKDNNLSLCFSFDDDGRYISLDNNTLKLQK